MRLRSTVLCLIVLAVAIAMIPTVSAASYTLSISPSTTVSLGTTMTIALSVSGGSKNTAYAILFAVVKPNGNGSATISSVLQTNNMGAGSIQTTYPNPSWTAGSGTVATDVGGVYSVFANQTSPTGAVNPVASNQFTVSSQLTVVTSQPIAGSVFQRGQTLTIDVAVSTVSAPDTSANVYANTPSNQNMSLPQTGFGVYSRTYQVLSSDPLGPWIIVVRAKDNQGNSGASSPVMVTITKNDLIVSSLSTYNQRGSPTTNFSPGDTIYAFFRIAYSSGPPITSGQYSVGLKNPSGSLVANLTASYDGQLFGFYTSSGYPVSTFDPGGTWTVVVGANSLNDGNGNTGPNLPTTVPVQIVTSPLSYWPFVVAGIVAVLGGLVTVKRFDTTIEGFQHLEEVIGGPLPRGASLLLLGDAGSGKTILSYQLLHDELESGRLCALLSYDAFPEDVQSRMTEFGWDIISHLRKGRLKIIDCYSGLAGQGEGAIKDPSDLTELNIQITSFIAKAKNGPVTVVLDSLTPIFNGVDEKQAINFIQTLGAKVKKTGGLFIETASKGAIPDDAAAKLKTMADGVIELGIVRSRGRSHRFLSVPKMERRRISSDSVPFQIDRTRGFVFRVSRFRLLKKRVFDFLAQHHLFRHTGRPVREAKAQSTRPAPARLR
jgi:KaiC/GvpD/RAD55 family RecA-like ATPase